MLKQFCVSNIDKHVTEDQIATAFTERGLVIETPGIQLKDGSAIVATEIVSLEDAITKLAGLKLNEKEIFIEELLPQKRSPKASPITTKLILKDIPEALSEDDLVKEIAKYGESADFVKHEDNYILTYDCFESAQRAKDGLSNFSVDGKKLEVELRSKKMGPRPHNLPASDCPLRILVPHMLVGAIIGRGGTTIREITNQTNARVDVLRHDSPLPNEKVVCISAADDVNCTDALKEILNVVYQERPYEGVAQSDGHLELKMLVPNELCGRLIGKKGLTIRSIMTDTSTSITVNATTSMAIIGPERVVVVYGPQVENLVEAAAKIYAKVKSCSEENNIMLSRYIQPQNNATYPGVNIMCMYAPPYSPVRPYHPQPYVAPNPIPPNLPQPNNIGGHLTVLYYIPKISVGAVIGSKGSFINYVKQDSHASCQIQQLSDEVEPEERPVKITGYQEGVWKACFHIYGKLKQEGFLTSENEMARTELMVPKSAVGRIIGKGGQNVRYIQEYTQCSVKFPEKHNQEEEEVPVQINGAFHFCIMAQSMIRHLLLHGQVPIAQPQLLPAPPQVLPAPPVYRNAPLRPPLPPQMPAYLPHGLMARQDRGDYSNM